MGFTGCGIDELMEVGREDVLLHAAGALRHHELHRVELAHVPRDRALREAGERDEPTLRDARVLPHDLDHAPGGRVLERSEHALLVVREAAAFREVVPAACLLDGRHHVEAPEDVEMVLQRARGDAQVTAHLAEIATRRLYEEIHDAFSEAVVHEVCLFQELVRQRSYTSTLACSWMRLAC